MICVVFCIHFIVSSHQLYDDSIPFNSINMTPIDRIDLVVCVCYLLLFIGLDFSDFDIGMITVAGQVLFYLVLLVHYLCY